MWQNDLIVQVLAQKPSVRGGCGSALGRSLRGWGRAAARRRCRRRSGGGAGVSGGAGVALEPASWMNLGISKRPRPGRDWTRPVVFRDARSPHLSADTCIRGVRPMNLAVRGIRCLGGAPSSLPCTTLPIQVVGCMGVSLERPLGT